MNLQSNYNNFVSWIRKKQLKNENSQIEIKFESEDEVEEIEYTSEDLPHLSILLEEFPFSQSIDYTIYNNGNKIKTGKLVLRELDEPKFNKSIDDSKPAGNIDINSILKNQNILMESLLKNQEIISEQRIRSIEEINKLKFESLRQSFDELLDNQKKIYEMRLDIEREKLESENSIESSNLMVDAMKEIFQEILPIGKEFLGAYLSKKSEISIPKGL
jgi:hypothetical protein